jgi:hypothetical protein
MDHVGTEMVDRTSGRAEGRQRQVKLPVEREVDRADRMNVRPVGRLSVVGMDELDVVASLGEVADELGEGAGNAVDLGEVGLGDQADSHRRLRASRKKGWMRTMNRSPVNCLSPAASLTGRSNITCSRLSILLKY